MTKAAANNHDHDDNDDYAFHPSADAAARIADAIADDALEQAAHDFQALDLAEQGAVLAQLPALAAADLLRWLDKLLDPDLFTYLGSARDEILPHLPPKLIARIISELDSDDALDLAIGLDDAQRAEVISYLSRRARAQLEEGFTFPDSSAGRLMQREAVGVPELWTVGKLLDYLRAASGSLPEQYYEIYTVDSKRRVSGAVSLAQILSASRVTRLEALRGKDIHTIPAEMDQEEVAVLFRRYGLVSAPVIDENERLLGMITADDVVDVIDEEAEEDMLKLGGVTNDDLYRAVFRTTGARFSWLFVNLLTAILASAAIGLFEASLQQIVALAVLMPIVASMGGNAGTQTLTVAVRALATRELTEANALRVIGKEAAVGTLNGLAFALITGAVAALWFQNLWLGVVIGAAMVINLFCAGLFGAIIPLFLQRLKIDPAVASAVFLTTITDVVGFVAFLGLATLFLL